MIIISLIKLIKDYNSIYLKWLAFFENDVDRERKEIYDSLHNEVKKSFDVVAHIAIEELEALIKDKAIYTKIKNQLSLLLAYSVLGGYILYFISEAKDPENTNLKSPQTEYLGETWAKKYDKDQCKDILEKSDPILLMILDKGKQARMNQLFMKYPEIVSTDYKQVAQIDKFLNWSAYQGLILAQLEEDLNKKPV